MLSFEEAKLLVQAQVPRNKTVSLKVVDARGGVLAKDVESPIALPPFDNSAVDGFAVSGQARYLAIESSIAAGDAPCMLPEGKTMRIMTGAPVPTGADAIVMQEDVHVAHGFATFTKTANPGDHIRRAGEDVRAGEKVLAAGTQLAPKHIGLLSAIGIEVVNVYRRPKIAIISTGSELVEPGNELRPGQVYFCNGQMLRALCEEAGAEVLCMERIPDDMDLTVDSLGRQLGCDLLLVAGGMSVGAHDYARGAFDKLGVKQIFFQGRWRPGKPLYFGQWESSTLVFGIPGNPVACFVIFHMFVRSVIEQMLGKSGVLKWKNATLLLPYIKKMGFTFFARGCVDEHDRLLILPGQGSHELGTLSKANALCFFDERDCSIDDGRLIPFIAI